jgi:hypothetical protein
MGLLTPRGEEDDGEQEVTVAGLEDLEGGDGDTEVVYELDEWSEPDRTVLRERLTVLGAPHSWEGTTLVVAGEDEGWVERIMDQVEEELAAAEEDDDEQVAYDLRDWDDESCLRLLEALAAEEIPYGLDDDELVVAGSDEARVDEIVAALSTPGATLTLGGPASFEAMSALFVAADQLRRDPEDRGAMGALVDGARTAAASSAPYGMEAAWWDGVVARAGALADLLESEHPDAEQVVDLAAGLRDELRPYI